jgi:YHS domain-containing protein
MKYILILISIVLIAIAALFIYQQKSVSNQPVANNHGHKVGQFGGQVIALGHDNYHLEVVFDKETIIIYTLDRDESKVIVVEKQVIEAYVKGKSTEQFSLGSIDGTKFVGKMPVKYLTEGEISIIFNIVIKGERFRATIVHNPQIDDEEKKLYLTPGGVYTEEDIIANGRITASQKFKNFSPQHDLKPKKGDRICPITLTKANPKCSWIIAGKEYWFCCPPCVEEFLTNVKNNKINLKNPEEYVK